MSFKKKLDKLKNEKQLLRVIVFYYAIFKYAIIKTDEIKYSDFTNNKI